MDHGPRRDPRLNIGGKIWAGCVIRVYRVTESTRYKYIQMDREEYIRQTPGLGDVGGHGLYADTNRGHRPAL